MHVIILGAGGVGSVIAAYLARAGFPVTMLARPGHVAAVKRLGLRVCGLEHFSVPVRAEGDPTRLREADVLLVTVKTRDMERALAGVRHMRVGFVASLQNGVVKNDQLAAVFGRERVVGSTTMVGARLVEDGVVEYTLDGVTFFGELDGRRSARVGELVGVFQASGLKGEEVENIVSIEWTKQAIQNPFAPLSALTRLPVHRVWSNRRLAELSIRMVREAAAVARAKGIELSPHPAWGFDIELFVRGPLDQAVDSLVGFGQRAFQKGYTRIVPSMLQDVLAGKKTEIEETVGYVAREGRRLGLSVPYTEFAYQAVKSIEESYEDRL